MSDRRWEVRLLAVIAMVLSVIGLIAVYGASSLVTNRGVEVGAGFALRQAVGVVMGGVLATVVARVDYHVWQRWAWPLLGLVALLLLIPLLPFTYRIAPVINGARRWVNLGFLTIQPSELAKLAIVIWVAMLAAKKGDDIRTFQRGVLPVVVVALPVIGLVFLEPNLSMALLITVLVGAVLFAAGAKIGHFLLLGIGAAPLVFGAVATAQYRWARVVTFLNSGPVPSEANWQVHQSLVGIGTGQLFGVGIGQGQQKLGYLPYAYSDFIFSTIAEEWGFLGVLAIVLLFAAFIWVGFRIARSARDPFGQLLAGGVTAVVGAAAVLHIGVNLAVLPATGITLPFVSYGRSSLLVSLIATGILAAIAQGRTGAVTEPHREPRGSKRARTAV